MSARELELERENSQLHKRIKELEDLVAHKDEELSNAVGLALKLGETNQSHAAAANFNAKAAADNASANLENASARKQEAANNKEVVAVLKQQGKLLALVNKENTSQAPARITSKTSVLHDNKLCATCLKINPDRARRDGKLKNHGGRHYSNSD
mmetsp:Transcript_18331/g.60450  ORF Transcript_18331/g.60450 Transcript_18331/m.60450 type:complete len:154 (-) Transcript_18331:290-751(-)